MLNGHKTMEELFRRWAKENCTENQPISAHGSARIYCRLHGNTHTCMAASNSDVRENEAFFYFSDFFRKHGIAVPEIYAVDPTRTIYLQQDLGDETLFDRISAKKRQNLHFDKEITGIYRKVIDNLVKIQLLGKVADFSHSYPRESFDRQSMTWDLNYFKYNFLKLAHIPFDEQYLENDFQNFITELDSENKDFFLYRDFQSRNIMIVDGEPYFIDYQGGRRGTFHYDLASLLYDAKAEIPDECRKELLDHYFEKMSEHMPLDKGVFLDKFYKFVILRILQAMGTYGYRGFYEGKIHFINSIAPALTNISNLLKDNTFLSGYPVLRQVMEEMTTSENLKREIAERQKATQLTVQVNSFSYKRGYPNNDTGNGGGFVFDCRALPNPGRYPEYRTFTGKDQPVIDFLKDDPEVLEFLGNVKEIVMQSVRKYTSRGFTNLQISFGCTGGQHRSVYCAEQIADFLSRNTGCIVEKHHLEQD